MSNYYKLGFVIILIAIGSLVTSRYYDSKGNSKNITLTKTIHKSDFLFEVEVAHAGCIDESLFSTCFEIIHNEDSEKPTVELGYMYGEGMCNCESIKVTKVDIFETYRDINGDIVTIQREVANLSGNQFCGSPDCK